MRTAPSWTEAVQDVGPLLRFRAAGLRGRGRRLETLGLALVLLLTLLAAIVPAFLPEMRVTRRDILVLMPTGYLGVLAISLISAAASGGGRELLTREQAVAYPISPTTDHLGALLMAPLNIAWLLQGWALLAGTAYSIGPRPGLALAQLPQLAWLFTATAVAQLVGWMVESIRRRRHGVLVVRSVTGLLAAVAAVIVATHHTSELLDRAPTLRIAIAVIDGAKGDIGPWLRVLVAIVLVGVAAVVLGAFVAGRVMRRPSREELKVESMPRDARTNPASDLVALLRTDRVSIWRSVPLRRGLVVLALMPGAVALAGSLTWENMPIMPGLVCSGGALLFGVNSWCLDGRGALWRDSLPVAPRLAFASRVIVLTEVLLVATAGTMLMAALRAGRPTGGQIAAVICVSLVVSVMVVGTSLRWSTYRPFSVDLRSARATPAPPLVMVGYSARLALSTTVVGMLFGLAGRATWEAPALLAVPFLCVSLFRLAKTADSWADPDVRSRVVAVVAS
ncbi:MAG: hypothetical protein ACRDPI_10370 [Nocardioidaceae bacterium]